MQGRRALVQLAVGVYVGEVAVHPPLRRLVGHLQRPGGGVVAVLDLLHPLHALSHTNNFACLHFLMAASWGNCCRAERRRAACCDIGGDQP